MNINSVATLTKHFWRRDLASLERIVTPLAFSLIVILLFAFSMPDLPREYQQDLMVAQSLVTTFFSLQIFLSRTFDMESHDRVFDMIRTSPLGLGTYLTAKLFHVFVIGLFLLFANVAMNALMNSDAGSDLVTPSIAGLFCLSVLGIASLGVLVSTMTLKAQARQILFPILFFPLATPVLISTSEAWLSLLNGGMGADAKSWIIILASFDLIFVTLIALLGADAVDQT
jgi:heme exporter protein B